MKELKDLKDSNVIVSMYVGESGSGKTHNLCTYPKCYLIITEPNSHQTWMNKPELRKNVVAFEYFIPTQETLKDMFINIKKEIDNAKKLYAEGKVETLGIDNLTYLIHNRWIWINKYEKKLTPRGEVDIRGMYGNLRTWCYNFMLMEVLSFKGNVVCNLHIMQESDEALEKKVDKSIVTTSNILGGFRNDIDGLFSNCFYLSKLPQKDGSYKYLCRTNKGSGRLAKNRFNLRTIIEDISYGKIVEEINKAKKGGGK